MAGDLIEIKKWGRTTRYSEELANELIDLFAGGMTLRDACEKLQLPAPEVQRWAADNIQGFPDRLHRAHLAFAHACADRSLAVAEGRDPACKPRESVTENEDGSTTTTKSRDVRADALLVRTLQWMAEKFAPTVFGSKVEVSQVGGPPANNHLHLHVGMSEQEAVALFTQKLKSGKA